MRNFIFILCLVIWIFICGCSHVNIGGSGDIGGVRGSGEVSIPVPKR